MYQKAEAVCSIPETDISDEVNALGGLEAMAGSSVTAGEGSYLVKAPIVIMDDAGFQEYCEQIGIVPKVNGTIVLNCIWDSINSNFRYKEYVPFIKEKQKTITLQNAGKAENSVEIPVLGFMITASYLNPMEFWVKAPIVPIAVFILAIFGFVFLAYYIGGKRMLNCNLADALRNDSVG